MTITIAPQYTQRPHLWTTFKTYAASKRFLMQYDDDGVAYTIWGYDGPEVYLTTIWKGAVPDGVLAGGYTQEQNDADKSDFESNYKTAANQPIAPLPFGTNLIGYLGGIGTGDYTPSPNEKLKGLGVAHVNGFCQDADGNLEVRGPVFTDEGSFRDDFENNPTETLTGTVSFTKDSAIVTGSGTKFLDELCLNHYLKLSSEDNDYYVKVARIASQTELELAEPYHCTGSGEASATLWVTLVAGAAAFDIDSSLVSVTLTTGSTDKIVMYREADYGPMTLSFKGRISDRRADQRFIMGFMDDATDPKAQIVIQADGTDASKVKLVTSNNGVVFEESTINLPAGISTAISATYEIQYHKDRVLVLVNGVPLGSNTVHLPDKYSNLQIVFIAENTDTTADSTDCEFDYIDFANQNELSTDASSARSWDGRQEIRLTPAMNGARLRLKVFSFQTADADSLHNSGPDGVLSDVALKMWKLVEGTWTETTTEGEATRTTCDFEPTYNYEIKGGRLYVPTDRRGTTPGEWFALFVGAPDIPSAYGGSVDFVNEIDLALVESDIYIDGVATTYMKYDPVYHTGKLRIAIMHPAGSQKYFQVFLDTFR